MQRNYNTNTNTEPQTDATAPTTNHNNTNTGTTNQDTDTQNKKAVQTNTCPTDTCNGNIIKDGKTQEQYCNECGLLVETDSIDHGAEWRNYDGENGSQCRVGESRTPTKHDRGLTTTIGTVKTDANGNVLSSKQRTRMARLRKWQTRTAIKGGKERGLKKGLVEIQRMTSALGLSETVEETSSMIFRQTSEHDMLEGRSIEGMASAALYTAARIENVTQTYDELEEVSRINKKEIKRAYMYIKRELELAVPPTPPKEYIPRFASKLNIPKQTELKAERILDNYTGDGSDAGAAPSSVAAAALYTAGLLDQANIPQREIKNTLNVTGVTLRSFYKDMLKDHNEFSFNDIGDEQTGKEDVNATDIKDAIAADD